jgi:uncharacterized damage-inducible protein DinB
MSAELLKQQYALLKGSRQVLFAYCENITPADLTKEMDGFGHGSIRNLLTHIADVYIHWLQNFALSRTTSYPDKLTIKDMKDVRQVFDQCDKYVDDFIKHYGDQLDKSITSPIPGEGKTITTTPLTLFTHALTHEFHHKGQILSMSRQLGYTPVDTDMIRS